MKDQFLGKMYQIVSMFGVRKKTMHQLTLKKQMRNGILFWKLFWPKGSFNNYVDQILPNFDPLGPPPLEWTIVDIFTWYLPFVTWLNVDSLLTPSSSCPRSFWMTPNSRLLEASFGAKLCYRNSISLPFHFYEPDNLRLEWKEMFHYFNCDWRTGLIQFTKFFLSFELNLSTRVSDIHWNSSI